MSKYESSSILEFLFNHCEHVNFQIRYRWNKNDMAFGIIDVPCIELYGIIGQMKEKDGESQ